MLLLFFLFFQLLNWKACVKCQKEWTIWKEKKIKISLIFFHNFPVLLTMACCTVATQQWTMCKPKNGFLKANWINKNGNMRCNGSCHDLRSGNIQKPPWGCQACQKGLCVQLTTWNMWTSSTFATKLFVFLFKFPCKWSENVVFYENKEQRNHKLLLFFFCSTHLCLSIESAFQFSICEIEFFTKAHY